MELRPNSALRSLPVREAKTYSYIIRRDRPTPGRVSFAVAPSLQCDTSAVRPGGGRVDAADLKSAGRKAIPVQIRARAPP